MITLNNAEATLLLPRGVNEFAGTDEELRELITNTYWVIDDAPYHWRVRRHQMEVLERLATSLGFTITGGLS